MTDRLAAVIVAYSGRRAKSIPEAPLASLNARVRDSLERLSPTEMVGAAADGADLVVLEAALSLTPPPVIHLVLSSDPEVFAEGSVAPEWRSRFDAALSAVRQRGGTTRSLSRDPGTAAYREANAVIFETAQALAGGAERLTVLLVANAGEGRTVEDLGKRASMAGVPVVRIEPG